MPAPHAPASRLTRALAAPLRRPQSIPIPLTGDDAAIKKYSQEVEALKKKVGMPDYEDVIGAELDYAFACAGQNVRKFVGSVLEDMQLGGGSLEGVGAEVAAAVEEAEAASGRELDAGNDKGWALLAQRIGDIERKHGLQDKAKVRDEAVTEMYKKHIASLREAVAGDVDKARKADGLEHIQPSLAALKPKLT